jgi:sugar/nucleoside kinase (ribokinase family)
MRYDFITIGGTTEDITFYTDEAIMVDNRENILAQKLMAFEYGAKLKIDKAHSTFGGGASNAAVCLSRLGFKVAAMVAVGDDERGRRIRDNFESQGVDTSAMQVLAKEQTGFTFFVVGRDKEHVGFSNRAANQKLSVGPAELELIDSAEWIYMTSLSGNWKSVLNNVFKTKAKIAWNPGHIQLHAGFKAIGRYLKRVEVLTVNKDEAIELVVTNPKFRDKDNRFLNRIKNLLEVIHSYGSRIVVVTNGKHGADVFDGEKFYHQDILPEKKRLDTTGVGDAFGSTFCAGLKLYNYDIAKAMRLAVKNTSSLITKQGAQNGLISKKDIIK